MGKTFERVDEEIVELIAATMKAHHQTLAEAGVKIDALMVADIDTDTGEVFPALKLQGYQCAATMKVNNLQLRALGNGGALLLIDQASWDGLSVKQRVALIDHELMHLVVKMDQGTVKRDDCGRPRLGTRLHDWQLGGFAAVARRHGENAIEVQAVRQCRENGQYFWDFGETPALQAVGA